MISSISSHHSSVPSSYSKDSDYEPSNQSDASETLSQSDVSEIESEGGNQNVSDDYNETEKDQLEKTEKKTRTAKKVQELFRKTDSWTSEEDVLLTDRINKVKNKYGKIKWCKLKIPGRSGGQCRQRWIYSLDPDINRAPASPEEREYIIKLSKKANYRIDGKISWKTIADKVNEKFQTNRTCYFAKMLGSLVKKSNTQTSKKRKLEESSGSNEEAKIEKKEKKAVAHRKAPRAKKLQNVEVIIPESESASKKSDKTPLEKSLVPPALFLSSPFSSSSTVSPTQSSALSRINGICNTQLQMNDIAPTNPTQYVPSMNRPPPKDSPTFDVNSFFADT